MNLIDVDYINQKDKDLVEEFISSTTTKKYILGINKFTKQVKKYIEVDGIIDDFTFPAINIAYSNQYHFIGVQFWAETKNTSEIRVAATKQVGQWHSVDIAAGRYAGDVHITMGVKPDQAHCFTTIPVMGGNACHGAHCN